jgi:4,5-DOPA dioxygenase extradiol
MYGFPEDMYRIEYPSPGSPELAAEVANAVSPSVNVRPDSQWGYDHGTWLPLMYMFPDADVPLIQMSIDYAQAPLYHFELAHHLRSLRSRGVMVIASGNLVHNLRRRGEPGATPFDWAEEFDTLITSHIRDGDYRAAVDFLQLGALASSAHPTYDHFLPLLYVLGVAEDGESVSSFNESFQEPSVSMKSFVVA